MLGSTEPSIEKRDMDSTPAPIPISIYLLLMALAMVITAYSPEEHCLLTTYRVVVSGNPAKNMPILAVAAPEPDYKQLPTQMSSTSLGFKSACWTTALKTGSNMASGGVSFWGPLFALVMAVLAIPTMTISSSLWADVFPRFIVGLAHTWFYSDSSLDCIVCWLSDDVSSRLIN